MRLALELMSLTYVLILVYLVLTHGRNSVKLVDSLFSGYKGSVRVLQGR